MLVKQISVFVENRPGSVYEVTGLLEQRGVDICALAIADTTNFGILRLIVADPDDTCQALRAAGFTASIREIVAISIENRPGGLHAALTPLKDAEINVEYGYSCVTCDQGRAILLLGLSDNCRGAELLAANGVTVLDLPALLSSR